MQANELLGLISGFLVVPVYITYFLQVKKGTSVPNPATWSIWVAAMLLNGATYSKMTGNFFESLIAIIVPILLLLMFFYIITRKKFSALKKTEAIVLIITFFVGILWKITNATISNLCLQGILLFSFWPTIRGLLSGQATEKPLPWLLGVVAYLFTVAANLSDFQGDYAKLVFPIVNGIIGNGSVGIIAIIKNRGGNRVK
ncbi:MAG: hypothetical protein PHT40_03565 [Patescibacteria group bacterium]|nr:hypothetical protein [Patescibacteria group bacterium]